MRPLKIDLPQAQIDDFCRRNHIRQLSVFGSVLRDDFGPESDVDLLVDFEPGTPVGFMALSRMQRELTALLHRTVDLVPQPGLKPKLRATVLPAAEVVYAA